MSHHRTRYSCENGFFNDTANTAIYTLDRGLSRLQMTMWSQIAHQVGRKDFEEFGRRIGLGNKLIKRELDEFVKEKPLVQVLIDRSFLSEELKK